MYITIQNIYVNIFYIFINYFYCFDFIVINIVQYIYNIWNI